ncbi:RDD family protein [Zhouia sp. PK063]|uniref:RDD family protein n=1 Tax=Zhouia sp. PK063 TaxID=3373602 RepID=UPI003797F87B
MSKIPESLYADKGLRFANYIVDRIASILLLYGIIFVISYVSVIINIEQIANFFVNINPVVDWLISTLFYILYYHLFEGITKGRSLGKYITKTIAIDQEGNPVNFERAFIRSLCRLIPFDPLSFLGNTARGWHDSFSKTYVVKIDDLQAYKQNYIELDQLGENTEE